MFFSVTEAVIDNALRRVCDGIDPLGIGTGLPQIHSGDRGREVVDKALTGLTGKQAAAVERALRKDPPRDSARIDLATVDLLLERGIDPLAVAWLASVDDGLSVHDNEDLSTVIGFDGEPFGAVTSIGEGALWSASCTLAIRNLPNALVNATVGNALRDIVSHPVLDRHPLVIWQARLAEISGFAVLQCRREAWVVGADRGQPHMTSHLAETNDLVDAHRRTFGK